MARLTHSESRSSLQPPTDRKGGPGHPPDQQPGEYVSRQRDDKQHQPKFGIGADAKRTDDRGIEVLHDVGGNGDHRLVYVARNLAERDSADHRDGDGLAERAAEAKHSSAD